jgi:hypothetical protein
MYKTIFFFILLTLAACNKKDVDMSDQNDFNEECPTHAIVNQSLFDQAPDDFLLINEVTISGDCMTIRLSSGGCSGDHWKVQLVGSENTIRTGIPKREIRLSLENPELCEAWISKEFSFNISEFRTDTSPMYLVLTNNESNYFYEF